MKNKITIYIAVILCAFSISKAQSQINYGSIEYEIKVNLSKRFPPVANSNYGGGRRSGGQPSKPSYLIESATLYFKDSSSLFVVQAMEDVAQQRQTYTTKTFINLDKQTLATQIDILGENFYVEDILPKREWKSTGKMRKILNFECHEVFTKINDSTKIYAWFSPEFVPAVGPESYWDLPGAILGLAYEDGSITYFAKGISDNYPSFEQANMPEPNKKLYNRAKLTNEFLNKYSSNARYTQLIKDMLHFF